MLGSIRDAMITSRANLTRGWMKFQATESTLWQDLHVDGEYHWSGDREHFRGKIQRIERFPGDRPQKDHGVRDVEAIRTPASWCCHDLTAKLFQRNVRDVPRTSFALKCHPHEVGYYLIPTKYRSLSERLIVDNTATTFAIAAAAENKFVIDRDLLPSGTHLRFVADWTRAGHICEFVSTPSGSSNHIEATAQWTQHNGGVWYPSKVEILVHDDDPSDPKHVYRHAITAFKPDQSVPANWFDPTLLKPPVGTSVAIITAQGAQYSPSGGVASNGRSSLDEGLRGAAEQLQMRGFSAPTRD
jgi:hypothetical protein